MSQSAAPSTPDGDDGSRGPRAAAGVTAALLVGALVNVVQFPVLELQASDPYEALHVKEGGDILDLVEDHFGSTERRFLLFATLRELAPGARVTIADVPVGDDVVEQLLGLSLAREVVMAPGVSLDEQSLAVVDAAAVLVGEDRRLGDFVLALGDGPVDEIVITSAPDDTTLVVDARLLTAATP